jgi:hypothetical protein
VWVFAVRLASNRFVLWAAFIAVHLWLGLVNLYSSSYPMGDVRDVYKGWMDEAIGANYWVGIDEVWVYPIVALLPMLAAYSFGPDLYPSTWLSLILVLDAVALATLTGWGRTSKNVAAGWWWVAFLLLLGPIAVGRIDAVSVPLALIGMLLLAAHPIAASVIITLATWIKVWPAAIIAAIFIAVKQRSAVLASAVATSLGIVVIALVFGSGTNVFSFITEQTARGLQVESPVATIWLWRAVAGLGDTSVYFDSDLLTFQLTGTGVTEVSALMTPLMAIAALVVIALGARALLRKTPALELVPVLSLAFVLVLIVFNKVGSPQYISWLAVPVLLGLVVGGATRRAFRAPIIVVLAIAVLTQAFYPYLYNDLLVLRPVMVIIITARNLLLVGLFVWAVVSLWRVPRRAPVIETFDETVWPLGSTDSAPLRSTPSHQNGQA